MQQLSRPRTRAKLGIAILVNLKDGNENGNEEFESFFFSHITLLEAHMQELRSQVEVAYLNKKDFIPVVIEVGAACISYLVH